MLAWSVKAVAGHVLWPVKVMLCLWYVKGNALSLEWYVEGNAVFGMYDPPLQVSQAALSTIHTSQAKLAFCLQAAGAALRCAQQQAEQQHQSAREEAAKVWGRVTHFTIFHMCIFY